MRHIQIILLALLSCINADDVDYTQNGDNWGDGCKGGTQSPIDLKTSAPKVNSNGDFFKFYQNLANEKIIWAESRSTNYVDFNTYGQVQTPNTKMSYFKSTFGKKVFKAPTKYYAQSFSFHSPSEHSVDGKLTDLEMHTLHFATKGVDQNGYDAATVGIMFDTTNYDKSISAETVQVIDNFFESLEFNKYNPTAKNINFGELMMIVDTDNRWVYKGSWTIPYCNKYVYWNIVGKVYPIKQKHLDYYRNTQLTRNTKQDIRKTGNNRRVQQTTDAHMLQMLTNSNWKLAMTTQPPLSPIQSKCIKRIFKDSKCIKLDEEKTYEANLEINSGLGCKKYIASKCEAKGVTTFKYRDEKCKQGVDDKYTPRFVTHGECIPSNGGENEKYYIMYRYDEQRGSSGIIIKASISALFALAASII